MKLTKKQSFYLSLIQSAEQNNQSIRQVAGVRAGQDYVLYNHSIEPVTVVIKEARRLAGPAPR